MNQCDLLHWIGLVQTDGHARINKSGSVRAIEFYNTNIKLVEKFCSVCNTLFGASPKINTKVNSPLYKSGKLFYSGAYALENKLGILNGVNFGDPPEPPVFLIKKSKNLFGAYLAGVIDGDGDVRIKRKNYPQCVVRISSGKPQTSLKNAIENTLCCKVLITNRQKNRGGKLWKNWYCLEFYVSRKNSGFIKNYLLPKIISEHKAKKLDKFLNS